MLFLVHFFDSAGICANQGKDDVIGGMMTEGKFKGKFVLWIAFLGYFFESFEEGIEGFVVGFEIFGYGCVRFERHVKR